MARFDLGLIDGNNWSASHVDLIEAALALVMPGSNTNGHTPRVAAARSSVQSIPYNVITALSWTDADEYDTDGFHDPASNASRITIPAGLGGIYRVGYSLYLPAAATSAYGSVSTWIYKNGNTSDRYGWQGHNTSETNQDSAWSGNHDMVLSAGDYVEVAMFQINTTSFIARNAFVVGMRSGFYATYAGPSS